MGKATAQAFSKAGAAVVVADVNADAGEQAANALRESGGEALFIETDVSKADDVKAMVDGTIGAFGRLDCAFNNAGVGGHLGFIHEYPEEWFDLMVNVNLKGVFLCLKYEIAYMLEHGGWRHREQLIFGRPSGRISVCGVRGGQARSRRAHAGGRAGDIAPRYTHQRHLPGRDEDADARGGRGRPGRVRGEEQGPDGNGQGWACRRRWRERSSGSARTEASFVTGTTLSIDGGKTAG